MDLYNAMASLGLVVKDLIADEQIGRACQTAQPSAAVFNEMLGGFKGRPLIVYNHF